MEVDTDQSSMTIINSDNNNNLENDNDKLSITIQTAEIGRDPKSWPLRKKILILFIISLAGLISPMSSTIMYPTVSAVKNDLNTSEVLANGLIGIYILFMGVAPLGWASYSDVFETRRNVYLASFITYIIGSVVCGFLRNIWLLLLMRSIQSCGASAVLSLGAGTIGDIFYPLERGRAYGIFNIGPLLGPVIGPVIGGYLTDYLGWKWVFWFLSIVGAFIVILIYFLLPETFSSESITNTSSITISTLPRQKRFDPIKPLILLRYPNMSLSVVYISIVFALFYVQNTLLSRTFASKYLLSSSKIGIVYLAVGAGFMAGSVLGGKWSDMVLAKAKERKERGNEEIEEEKKDSVAHPEMRIHSIWIGVILLSASYICYGWFLNSTLHLAFPITTMFIGGFGVMSVFVSISTYLVDAFPGQNASAIAVSHFCRTITAAIFIFTAAPFEDAVGTGWIYTIMVCASTIGIFCLMVVCYKGKDWREKLNNEVQG